MITGRPTIFSEELAESICERLKLGESLNSICADDDMPEKLTVLRWLDQEKHKDFCNQYAQARLVQADHMTDEAYDVVTSEENPQMINAKVNALLAIQARLSPKKYGTQKVGLGQDPDAGPMKIEVVYVESNPVEAD